jgi:hypothetical protein
MTNKIQLCRIIYCSLTALHVSSDIFAHHQEHLNCNYIFWFYSLASLPAAAMAATDNKVKPEAATAVIELLMMGGTTPETC